MKFIVKDKETGKFYGAKGQGLVRERKHAHVFDSVILKGVSRLDGSAFLPKSRIVIIPVGDL